MAYGPIFPTDSKADASPAVGLDGLKRAAELAGKAGIPLVAIGGLTVERGADVAAIADACAVIGGLLPASGGSEGDGTLAGSPGAAALHEATARARAYASLYARSDVTPHREATA